MALVMVEGEYDPPKSQEVFLASDEGLMSCMQARDIRWVRSFLSADGSRSVCCFEAEDAETVRDAFRRSGVPFQRIWTALELGP